MNAPRRRRVSHRALPPGLVDKVLKGDRASERELCARVLDNDCDAQSALHLKVIPELIARTRAPDRATREDREDVEQKVRVSVSRGLANFRHDSALSTWITRIVINAWKDWERARDHRPATTWRGDDDLDKISDPDVTVDETLDEITGLPRAYKDWVSDAGLTDFQESVLYLHLGGYTYKNIATQVAESERVVRYAFDQSKAHFCEAILCGEERELEEDVESNRLVQEAHLTPDERRVFLLRRAGVFLNQITTVTGMSERRVATLWKSSIDKLRDARGRLS